MGSGEWVADPAVSREKFDRELAEYRKIEDIHVKKGCWILKAAFPEVLAVFAAPQLKPTAVLFGALIDFRNYDFWAPSVRLVNPFTRVPYKHGELPFPGLMRAGPNAAQPQNLIAAFSHEDVPFICMPGIREYHEHPGHSGDDWLLHRGRGEGTLYFILEKLILYGVSMYAGYAVDFQLRGILFAYDPARLPK